MSIQLHERGFEYKVSVNITLTADDLRLIKRASEMHYDHNCQTFFSDKNPAPGNRWRNSFPMDVEGEEGLEWIDPLDEKFPGELVSEPITVSFDDIDRVSKILEVSIHDREGNNASRSLSLRVQFRKIILAIEDEQKRIRLGPLFDEKQDLNAIPVLSDEQLTRLGEINKQIDRLEQVYR